MSRTVMVKLLLEGLISVMSYMWRNRLSPFRLQQEFDGYWRMVSYLHRNGVDVRSFNRKSAKTLGELYEETENKDAKLGVVSGVKLESYIGQLRAKGIDEQTFPHAKGPQVILIRQTVKILVVAEGKYKLEESKRVFRRLFRNREIPGNSGNDWSLSETRKIKEDEIAAALRGLRDECGFPAKAEDIVMSVGAPEIVPHPSSVYAGILTVSIVQRGLYFLDKRPWLSRVAKDSLVRLYFTWKDWNLAKMDPRYTMPAHENITTRP